MWKNKLDFQNVIAITFHLCFQFQDYFWMLQFTDRFSSLNHQVYWKKKISKCSLTISNFLTKSVWLLSFWIEYGNNYQLSFPESEFIVNLCNLIQISYFKGMLWGHLQFYNIQVLENWSLGYLLHPFVFSDLYHM